MEITHILQHKRAILVVEVNSERDDSLSQILKEDYEVFYASNVKDAFNCLLDNFRDITSVFLDNSISSTAMRSFIRIKKDYAKVRDIPTLVILENPNISKERACYNAGADDFVVRPFTKDKLKRRVANAVRQYENAKLLRALEIDRLTGLYTYTAFLEHVNTVLSRNNDHRYTMIVINVVDMKLVNERYGLVMGDQLLRYIGHAIANMVFMGFGGRMSGDRFCCFVYYENLSEEEIENKLHELMSRSPIPNVKVHVGIYRDIDKSLSAVAICDRARLALNNVAKNKRCCFAIYDKNMLQQSRQDKEFSDAFNEAIAKEEFEVWYQPKIDPRTNVVNGAEALVRWRRNDKLIPPYQFIGLFERTGDITRLDKYVFTKTCQELQKLHQEGIELDISVNLSRQSMYNDNLAQEYSEIAKAYSIPLEKIPIEITETATIDNLLIQKRADELDAAGFALSMDDFGTGSSTLASFDELRFSRVKLDKSLIDKIGCKKGELLLKHTIELCLELGIYIVAEGVERCDQVEFLLEHNCPCVQGYFYSKPLPQAEFEKFLYDNLKQTSRVNNK